MSSLSSLHSPSYCLPFLYGYSLALAGDQDSITVLLLNLFDPVVATNHPY